MKIKFKFIFIVFVILGLIMDVFEFGYMSVGIVLGWIIGIGTLHEWHMVKKEKLKGGNEDDKKKN